MVRLALQQVVQLALEPTLENVVEEVREQAATSVKQQSKWCCCAWSKQFLSFKVTLILISGERVKRCE